MFFRIGIPFGLLIEMGEMNASIKGKERAVVNFFFPPTRLERNNPMLDRRNTVRKSKDI
jgi:hypothetical protein